MMDLQFITDESWSTNKNIGCKFNKGRSESTRTILLILTFQLPSFINLLILRFIFSLIFLKVCRLILNHRPFEFPEFQASIRLCVLVNLLLIFRCFFAIFSHTLRYVFRPSINSFFETDEKIRGWMAFNVSLAARWLMVLEACSDGYVTDHNAIHQISGSFEGVDRFGCRYEKKQQEYVEETHLMLIFIIN